MYVFQTFSGTQSLRGQIWSKSYSLDYTHFWIFLLISIEICQEIEYL